MSSSEHSDTIGDFDGFANEQNHENPSDIQLVRTVTSGHGDNVLERLETLSREMSRVTTRDGPLSVDPNDFDLNRLLRLFLRRASVDGIKLRDVGVSFDNLSVFGVDQSVAFLPTLTDILKGPIGAIQRARELKSRADRVILSKVSGYVESGEMLLVLGRPGAGCLTFLKTISGTDLKMYKGQEGLVEYDGIDQKQMLAKFRSDLVYNPELDVHFPHLTVQQTLDFAIECKTPRTRVDGMSAKEHVVFTREMLATVFGLRHTYKTKVGNDFVRGVSGGQRKRVSIAEAMACNGTVYCWDNATRGLDASTALEYARAIRISANLMRTTALVSIYQAGENIYETFDKVTVLYQGRQVYFGRTTEARAYFEDMGFQCPPRQTTAEFLTAVTDPAGRFPKPGFEHSVPNTADEFQDRWLHSPEYAALQKDIATYRLRFTAESTQNELRESVKQQQQRMVRSRSHFTVNYYQQFRLCLKRSFQNIRGDTAYVVIQIVAAVSQALIVGSLYYNTPETVAGAFSRGGVIFFAVLYMSLTGLAEVSNSFVLRPILMKQHNYNLYHPSAFAVAESIAFVPVSLVMNIFFGIIIYFLSNLAREAGKFFTFVLFSFLVALAMSNLFKAVASWNKTIAGANAFAGVFVLASLMYLSYMIQRPSMHPWFKWISYINPVLYGFEAMLTTEFHGREMPCTAQNLTPNGPGYLGENQVCSFTGSVKGQSWVSGDLYVELAYLYSFSHVWRNFGILIAFIIFFMFVSAMGHELVRPVSGGIDRLFFLRGKASTSVVLPDEKNPDDEESGPASEALEKNSGTDADAESILGNLATKDIFAWRNIDYVIPYDGGQRKLLEAVSGYCIPGKLTALMGESGAGKTTLLNCLSQRINMGVVTGEMLVNGGALDSSFVRRTGYVQQQDIHLAQATVRESLRFAARMRRPESVPDKEKLDYVEKIIKVLDMEEYADAIVGASGSGLNVEQRKKLTIGVELVAKPSLLLFLDEPTSGLDSQSAWAIVQLLKDLALAGQAVLCTIHQPSATLFEEFDRLLLLKKGGQTVYFGDIGKRSTIITSYFEKHGGRPCTQKENPAEYILEVIGAGATAKTDQDWFEVWNKSDERMRSDRDIDDVIKESSQRQTHANISEAEIKQLSQPYATSMFYQFRYVLVRNALVFWRSPEYIMAKLMLMMINGLFIGFTFFGLAHTLTGMQNGMFCAFLSVVVSAPAINQIQELCLQGREQYEGREMLSKTYRWWLMVLVQFVNEIPYCIFCATIMFLALYFPTQADTSGPHAGVFYLTFAIFLQLFNISFGLMLAYLAPDIQSAAVLVSFFYSFIVGFAGVVQPESLMPGFWTFMYKVSPYTYIIQNLVASFLHGRTVTCSVQELAYVDPPSGQTCGEYFANYLRTGSGYLVDPSATENCGYCQYKVADQYLLSINIKYSYVWRNVGFYCVYFIFNMAAAIALYKLFRLLNFSFSNMFKRLGLLKISFPFKRTKKEQA